MSAERPSAENLQKVLNAPLFFDAVYKVVRKNNAYSGKNADNESDAPLFFDDVYINTACSSKNMDNVSNTP